jgi:2-amino-4-hydroxy-6-hydroxymethyldihydropteridine diphosphokinase
MSMAAEHQVCLLLGSNIQPEFNLPLAVERLSKLVIILRISRVWESPPVGTSGPNFLNAALLARTPLENPALKSEILIPLEANLGRMRSADKNAPRPIDLDIILFDGQILDPSLWQFAHRAVPMAEIQPELRSDDGQTLKEAAERFLARGHILLREDLTLVNSE